MPILNYKCNNCDNTFPKLVLAPDDAPRNCPVCGSPNPEYVGQAFNTEERDVIRRSCMTCDECGESMCGIAESS
jgi:putative FmdB family regulatory protein